MHGLDDKSLRPTKTDEQLHGQEEMHPLVQATINSSWTISSIVQLPSFMKLKGLMISIDEDLNVNVYHRKIS